MCVWLVYECVFMYVCVRVVCVCLWCVSLCGVCVHVFGKVTTYGLYDKAQQS